MNGAHHCFMVKLFVLYKLYNLNFQLQEREYLRAVVNKTTDSALICFNGNKLAERVLLVQAKNGNLSICLLYLFFHSDQDPTHVWFFWSPFS